MVLLPHKFNIYDMIIRKYSDWKRMEFIKEEDEFDESEDIESNDDDDVYENENPEVYIKKSLNKISKKITGYIEEDKNLSLETEDINRYTRTHYTLTIKYSDDDNMYHILFRMSLKDSVDKSKEGEMDTDKLEDCFVKLKQYDNSLNLIGEFTDNIKIKDIDGDILSSLKSELGDDIEEDGIGFEYE